MMKMYYSIVSLLEYEECVELGLNNIFERVLKLDWHDTCKVSIKQWKVCVWHVSLPVAAANLQSSHSLA